MSFGARSTSNSVVSVVGGALIARGAYLASTIAPSVDSAAIARKVIRHPYAKPIHDPAGTPKTCASVSPPKMVAKALPRASAGTRAAPIEAATGVTRPPPSAISPRAPSRIAKFGAAAAANEPSANKIIPMVSRRARSIEPVTAIRMGEETP